MGDTWLRGGGQAGSAQCTLGFPCTQLLNLEPRAGVRSGARRAPWNLPEATGLVVLCVGPGARDLGLKPALALLSSGEVTWVLCVFVSRSVKWVFLGQSRQPAASLEPGAPVVSSFPEEGSLLLSPLRSPHKRHLLQVVFPDPLPPPVNLSPLTVCLSRGIQPCFCERLVVVPVQHELGEIRRPRAAGPSSWPLRRDWHKASIGKYFPMNERILPWPPGLLRGYISAYLGQAQSSSQEILAARASKGTRVGHPTLPGWCSREPRGRTRAHRPPRDHSPQTGYRSICTCVPSQFLPAEGCF